MFHYATNRFRWSFIATTLLGSLLLALVFIPDMQVKAQPNSINFPIGPGMVDLSVHQIVRTNDDRVFIFGGEAAYSTAVVGYWTTVPG